jgi:hypothetical protein
VLVGRIRLISTPSVFPSPLEGYAANLQQPGSIQETMLPDWNFPRERDKKALISRKEVMRFLILIIKVVHHSP